MPNFFTSPLSKGVIAGTNAGIRYMGRKGKSNPDPARTTGGVVLNVSSIQGLVCWPCMPAYSASKAGKPILSFSLHISMDITGISSHLVAKLRDWADGQAEAGCYSWAALPSNDYKRYFRSCGLLQVLRSQDSLPSPRGQGSLLLLPCCQDSH